MRNPEWNIDQAVADYKARQHTNVYGESCGWCLGRCDECGAQLPGDDFCVNGHDVEHLREECGVS